MARSPIKGKRLFNFKEDMIPKEKAEEIRRKADQEFWKYYPLVWILIIATGYVLSLIFNWK